MFSDGMFGNNLKTYHSVDELLLYKNLNSIIIMRYKGLSGGGYCYYNISVKDALHRLTRLSLLKKAEARRFYFNETANDSKILIQGEISESERGIELRYSHYKQPMRIALEHEELNTYGLKAKSLLKHYMTPSSYDDLMEVISKYPNHVIEFSTWSYNFGSIPGRNTIVWEVRKY